MTGPILAFGGASADLKDDLTVVITKSGRQPVEVVVHQKGTGEWKLKETETAEQPEYVSQAVVGVLAYLSRLVGSVEVRDGNPLFSLKPVGRTGGLGLQAGTPVRISTKIDRTAPGLLSVQQRLDEIQKEQERVTKALDELRKSLREHPSQN
jgi:hypothetical protein